MPPAGRRRKPTQASGRICEIPDCGTRLSIHNSTERCSVHTRALLPRSRNAFKGALE
jgi:hypothetical protein